jgi:hypothetical protein
LRIVLYSIYITFAPPSPFLGTLPVTWPLHCLLVQRVQEEQSLNIEGYIKH